MLAKALFPIRQWRTHPEPWTFYHLVGVNTTIFSVVHGILTKPAPGVLTTDLVTLSWISSTDWIEPETSYANYADLASQAKSVRLAASFPDRLTLSDDNGTCAVWGAQVSANYFDVLGVRVGAGRGFTADEHRSASSGLVAMISHTAWQTYFQGRHNIAGTPILLNGQSATIVGVIAPPFRGSLIAPAVDVWVPFAGFARALGRARRAHDAPGPRTKVIGRLREESRFRVPKRRWPRSGRQADTFLAIFSVITLITLLIVCANVANLLPDLDVARAVWRRLPPHRHHRTVRRRVIRHAAPHP